LLPPGAASDECGPDGGVASGMTRATFYFAPLPARLKLTCSFAAACSVLFCAFIWASASVLSISSVKNAGRRICARQKDDRSGFDFGNGESQKRTLSRANGIDVTWQLF